MDSEAKNLIELLATQEEELSFLYHGYSFLFPDKEFWQQLSKEESIHQSWVLSLSQSPDVTVDKKHFQFEPLKTMVGYIREKKQEYKNHDLLKALSISLDIEKSLLENEFFKIYETDSADVQRVFNDLAKATKIHVSRVEEELNRVKREAEHAE